MDTQLFSMLGFLLTDPMSLLLITVGVVLGYIFGALPGLTATLGVALLTPLTFSFPVEQAVAMMCALYCGAMTGGAIPAILLRIPGTPSAVITTLDGYPMAKQGKAMEAYGWALTSSVFAGLVAWAVLALMAPPVARWALNLGSPEYAALACMSMTLIASVVSSDMIWKGVVGALMGIGFSVVGFDEVTGQGRWIFNTLTLTKGIAIMPAMIGLLVIPEIFNSMYMNMIRTDEGSSKKIDKKKILAPFKEYLHHKTNFILSSVIGTAVGVVPALGGNIASMLAYDYAKKYDPDGKNYGNGEPGGVIASEAANNGVTGGALIPLLTLGIPADSVTAMLLGGLMIHGIQPGPRLFDTSGPLVWNIIAALLLANIIMFFVGYYGIQAFVKSLEVPKRILAPVLLVLTTVGTYALNNSHFDVLVMMCLGIIGFICLLADFPVYPIVIGIILGPLLERELRQALLISGGDWNIFITRPVSVLFLVLTVASLVAPAALRYWRKRKAAQQI